MNLRLIAAAVTDGSRSTFAAADDAALRAELDRLALHVVAPLRQWATALGDAVDDVDDGIRGLREPDPQHGRRDRLVLRDGLNALKRQLADLVADIDIPAPRTAAHDTHPIRRVSATDPAPPVLQGTKRSSSTVGTSPSGS